MMQKKPWFQDLRMESLTEPRRKWLVPWSLIPGDLPFIRGTRLTAERYLDGGLTVEVVLRYRSWKDVGFRLCRTQK
jgi:hypothetical protein